MGLFNFKKKKQEYEYLLQWQNSILDKPSATLMMTREELLKATKDGAENDLRIIKDCMNIIHTTLNPDTFFTRLNLLVEVSNHIRRYEPHVEIENETPTHFHLRFVEKYQDYVRSFLHRYYSDTFTKASTLKTIKGRLNKFQKWHDSLQEYYRFMNQENIDMIESDYRLNTKSLQD